jgi:hypothetical protein
MSWKTAVLVVAATIGVRGAADAADPVTPPVVPTDIEVPAGYKPILVAHAYGTQNYMCVPAATPTGGDWFFLGPQATVFKGEAQEITHFLSKNPFKADALHATWQHSRDSSVVWATRKAGATGAPGAIEWLLLEMTGAQVGPTGGYKLARTRYIQRVNTVGGMKPPAAECTVSTVNARRLVSYEADYYFYE